MYRFWSPFSSHIISAKSAYKNRWLEYECVTPIETRSSGKIIELH